VEVECSNLKRSHPRKCMVQHQALHDMANQTKNKGEMPLVLKETQEQNGGKKIKEKEKNTVPERKTTYATAPLNETNQTRLAEQTQLSSSQVSTGSPCRRASDSAGSQSDATPTSARSLRGRPKSRTELGGPRWPNSPHSKAGGAPPVWPRRRGE
jgi:hypothetical protein